MSGEGDEKPVPLSVKLFETQMTICTEFKISPFQIRRERFSEFCLLVRNLEKFNETKTGKPTTVTTGGKTKKYLPVTDYKEPIKKEVASNG